MLRVAPKPRFLTTGSAAELASCHRATILRAIAAGELEAVRLGTRGDYRIPVAAFEAWLQPTTEETRR